MLNISPFSLSRSPSHSHLNFSCLISFSSPMYPFQLTPSSLSTLYLFLSFCPILFLLYQPVTLSLSHFFPPSLSLDYRQFLLEWRILFLSYRDTIYLIARRESNTYMDSALCDRLLNKDKKVRHVLLFCISTTQSRHTNWIKKNIYTFFFFFLCMKNPLINGTK